MRWMHGMRCGAVLLVAALMAAAQSGAVAAQEAVLEDEGPAPVVDPGLLPPVPDLSVILPVPAVAPEVTEIEPVAAPPLALPHDPGRGAVTNLPLPRYVTLKGDKGFARRGPSLTHRIDWVFTRTGMPLKVTAEFEQWRRVEDAEGAGGWMHYVLLSGTRSVLVTEDMAEFHAKPDLASDVVLQAEYGVVARLLECEVDWCRISADGTRGWVQKRSIWGVDPGEIVE